LRRIRIRFLLISDTFVSIVGRTQPRITISAGPRPEMLLTTDGQ
jgi:hypothetical protein